MMKYLPINFDCYDHCTLCPRECQVNRKAGKTGYCGETDQLRISSIGAHHGEEPPISGKNGSGTFFFSGCSLRCCYCQNYQISLQGMGKITSCEEAVSELLRLIRQDGIHNINFVTPDHFLPHTIRIVELLRRQNISIPILYNFSGYQKVKSIRALETYADIYLPDFKYADEKLAEKLSHAADYPETALAAISEMIKQKGILDSYSEKKQIATRGVLVRHLILPARVQNSRNVLTTLLLEFGKDLPISLMSQYYPPSGLIETKPFRQNEFLKRNISTVEFEEVYEHALKLGFTNIFVQFPHAFKSRKDKTDFVPDFQKENPFR